MLIKETMNFEGSPWAYPTRHATNGSVCPFNLKGHETRLIQLKSTFTIFLKNTSSYGSSRCPNVQYSPGDLERFIPRDSFNCK